MQWNKVIQTNYASGKPGITGKKKLKMNETNTDQDFSIGFTAKNRDISNIEKNVLLFV